MRPKAHSSRGMSLLEVLIAGAIVTVVLLTLLGAISFGLEGTRSAAGHQEAVYHARHLMELIRERRLAEVEITPPKVGFDDAPSVRDPLHQHPFADDFPADTHYTRRLLTQRVSTDSTDHRSRLYRVVVEVFWKAKGRENTFRLAGYYRAP